MRQSGPRRTLLRGMALTMAGALAMTLVPSAAAAEPIGDGVSPTFDEAYYATLDYYGNLTEGSVVKSYTLNGASSITDYGTYDAVNNLTDGTEPVTGGDTTTFDFGGDAPDHFYFEGKTTRPFQDLPWTLSLHYALNGVPTRAEDLAGKTGVVEISLDIVPNENASEYARNNYTLEAMAMFNQDNILSLKADGAQVQLIGNLRVVLFLALPGEEQHFTIEVGTDSFEFAGMTFLMVPATLSQLEQIADISQNKEELEDDYHKLSGSFDSLLSAMNNLTGSLNASASGLDQLNQARDTFSSGKGTLYDGADALREDLSNIGQLLEPVTGQLESLSRTITDAKGTLNEMTDIAVSLKGQLRDVENAMEDLEDNADDIERLVQSLADMEHSLRRLEEALDDLSGGTGGSSGTDTSSRELVKKVKAVHAAYEETDLERFMSRMLVINGTAASAAQGDAMAAQLMQLADVPAEAVGTLPPEQQAYWQSAQQLKALYGYARSGASFQSFCEQLPGVSKTEAKQMNDLWIVYSSGQLDTEEGQALYASLLLNDPADSTGSGSDVPDAGDQAPETPETPEAGDGEDGESSSVGGAAVDLITSGLDSASGKISELQKQLNSTLKNVAGPTANVVGELADLCEQLDDLVDLLDDADDLAAVLRRSSQKLQSILDLADTLRNTLNDYEPRLQESLTTVSDLSTAAAKTTRDLETLVSNTETLLKNTGADLDPGTRQTLEGLASTLRRTADVMATSRDIQSSKNAMTDIIEDLWNDHTGDVDRLLMMDATAEAESLTDARNGTPQSVQVLIRSQEIQIPDGDEETETVKQAESTTFWGRVAQMFRDFWNAVTGVFRR